ncbi:MAG: tetratricopeptide repeat protein [Acidobacteriota bacterium]
MCDARFVGRSIACLLFVAACASVSSASPQAAPAANKIPITTSSSEARALYLQGRDLADRLRATDARKLYEQAVAKDPTFALGYLALASTSGTTKEFIDGTTRAAALAGGVSEGERHQILGLEAAMKGEPAGMLAHYTELVRLFPEDERAHNLLGNLYFGRQDYDAAIRQYVKATSINPSFSQPYNQLGYAYRFVEQFDQAETAFRKYTQLIPNDPNPYDSYAELLMKIGRFDEATTNYRKALSIDPNFVASYVGIGCVELSKGHPDQARASFAKIDAVARNTGERRLARFWTSAAYVHEGATDQAIEELKAEYALAEAERDYASMSGDLNQMGDVLREAGRRDQALAKYAEAVRVINQAPAAVQDVTRRNHVFEQGRVAVAAGDLADAKAKAAQYVREGEAKKVPFEIRQQHELAGLIALAEKRYPAAADELRQANQQDPRILYLTAIALKHSGDSAGAARLATKAAAFNGLSFNYGYVRAKALSSAE